MQWYYAIDRQQLGPIGQEALVALAREGKLGPDDLVWNASMGNRWAKASTVAGLFDATAPGSPEQPPSLTPPSDHVHFESQTPNRDLMAQARAALTGHWGLAVGGVLVYLGVQAVIGLLNIVPLLGSIISFLVAGPLAFGLNRFFLTLARRQPATVGMLFDGFKRFGTAFFAALFMGLLILAWMLPSFAVMGALLVLGYKKALSGTWPLGGVMFCLLIPVLIATLILVVIAQIRYSMTYFIINDQVDVGAMEAIQRSTRMMKGNKWKYCCLQCRFIGWALLCLPTFGIGFLWLFPYLMTSLGRFYDELIAESWAENGTANNGQ